MKYTIPATVALSAIAFSFVSAHRCSADIAERGLKSHEERKLAARAKKNRRAAAITSPTDEASEASFTDPAIECAAYYDPDLNNLATDYPAIWTTASIVAGDTEAQNVYNSIINDPNFPNLPLKGTIRGAFYGNYSTSTDPDCWWSATRCTTPKHANLPADITSCPEPNTWGLSYDDGPNCTHNAFYNFLNTNNQKATMFFIGSNVLDWPYQAQRAVKDGHEIGIHTWAHGYSTGLTNEQMFAELWYTRKAIKQVLGINVTTWRAPYGDVDDRVRFIGNKLGLELILWDADTFDWQVTPEGVASMAGTIPSASVEANYQALYASASAGSYNQGGLIVLSHELNDQTMGIAMTEYPNIKANFKNVQPVSVCRNKTVPYINDDGSPNTTFTLPNFEQYAAGARSGSSNGTSTITSAANSATGSATTSSPRASSTGTNGNGSGSGASSTGTSLLMIGFTVLALISAITFA